MTPSVGDELALTLLSPTYLLTPDFLKDSSTLSEGYRKTLLSNGFELVDGNFFAEEALFGGYLSHRFKVNGKLVPWCLTQPGSVFKVKVNDESLAQDVLRNGLHPAGEYKAKDWQIFPFLRESGYGHVATDLIDHSAFKDGLALKEGH